MISVWKAARKSLFFRELCEEIIEGVWEVYKASGESKAFTAELLGISRPNLYKFFDYIYQNFEDERFKPEKKDARLVAAHWRMKYSHHQASRVERLLSNYVKKKS